LPSITAHTNPLQFHIPHSYQPVVELPDVMLYVSDVIELEFHLPEGQPEKSGFISQIHYGNSFINLLFAYFEVLEDFLFGVWAFYPRVLVGRSGEWS
jgi:hypothetical protein